jgi:hypothetical protein
MCTVDWHIYSEKWLRDIAKRWRILLAFIYVCICTCLRGSIIHSSHYAISPPTLLHQKSMFTLGYGPLVLVNPMPLFSWKTNPTSTAIWMSSLVTIPTSSVAHTKVLWLGHHYDLERFRICLCVEHIIIRLDLKLLCLRLFASDTQTGMAIAPLN